MSTVTKEIMNLARKAGYEGEDKTNVTKAIDALADTLASENLEQATNVAAAIRKLQPYVGGGGSGEATSYTLENYNKIKINIPEDTTLQENEVDAWVDERIESWINGQIEDLLVHFDYHSNLVTDTFNFLLDKNKNIIDIEIEPEAPAVGGGILLAKSISVFLATIFEKENIGGIVSMFDPSSNQNGYHHLLYAIRTEYDDNDLLVPLEVIDRFDVDELIEDVITMTIPGEGDFPMPLVNYPSLNSPLSLDDFAAAGFSPDQIVEPRIVLCEIYISFPTA